jgi:hypothetical protein
MSRAARTTAAPTAPAPQETVFDMPMDKLRANAAGLRQKVAEGLAALPGLLRMTAEQRKGAKGRLRDGEEEALAAIFATTQAYPQFFEALADHDFGKDPKRFEPEVLVERIERFLLIKGLREVLAAADQDIADTALQIGAELRVPAKMAYDIAKPLARVSPAMQTTLAPANRYYADISKKGVATKKKRKKGQ